MAGNYFGYDGPPAVERRVAAPCIFTLYALRVARLDVSGVFTGAAARDAILPQTLDRASVTGRYALNPRCGCGRSSLGIQSEPGRAPRSHVLVDLRIEREPARVVGRLGERQRRGDELVAAECMHRD